MFEAVAFYLFAILTIVMFVITVMTKNALYALSSLAAGMIFISAFFFLLEADFLGVVQIIVYTGAVMALYAFGMMFFDTISNVEEKIANPRLTFLLTGLVALVVVVIVVSPIIGANITAHYPIGISGDHPGVIVGNVQDIGIVLFTKYLIPFELAAVMLLVAMIGGIILAGKKMDMDFTKNADNDMNHLNTNFNNKKDV